jgi:hypothetical protein
MQARCLGDVASERRLLIMVRLGIHLRELSRARTVWIPSLLIAALLALTSVNTSHIYGAHTQILVNEPEPGILSTGTGVTSYDWLNNGALLLGNIMTSDPGDDYVARAAHVPLTSITFDDPQSYFLPTPNALPKPGTPPYTVAAVSDPSVPMVDVYATAPSQAMALRLVNAAYTGLREYLSGPGSTGTFQLQITQLGHGHRVDADGPSPVKGALEHLILYFVVFAFVGMFLLRGLHAWRAHRSVWLALSARGSRPASATLIRLSASKDL